MNMSENALVLNVSQLNAYIKAIIQNDPNLKAVNIRGEISNFTNHRQTGHFYFTLKDEHSSIRAIMFGYNTSKLSFMPENGMKVLISGNISVFERDGAYQLYCNDIIPDGIGELYKAFEQLKQKLEKQGLFDQIHKKAIPLFPKKIAAITSKSSAAIEDIKNILSRRYPLVELVVVDALVQGINAPKSLLNALKKCEMIKDIDTIIIGRGGGSIEDLWAFNDENLAYAIFECKTPIISAVGHEIDYTICDFVADLRAPTPSAAAEIATPDINEINKKLDKYKILLYNYTLSQINNKNETLITLSNDLFNNSPQNKILTAYKKIDELKRNLEFSVNNIIERKNIEFSNLLRTLNALNPLNTLSKGYSITYLNDELIKNTNQIKINDKIKTILPDGIVFSEVSEVKSNGK